MPKPISTVTMEEPETKENNVKRDMGDALVSLEKPFKILWKIEETDTTGKIVVRHENENKQKDKIVTFGNIHAIQRRRPQTAQLNVKDARNAISRTMWYMAKTNHTEPTQNVATLENDNESERVTRRGEQKGFYQILIDVAQKQRNTKAGKQNPLGDWCRRHVQKGERRHCYGQDYRCSGLEWQQYLKKAKTY